jgi:HAMP domain-containing protein
MVSPPSTPRDPDDWWWVFDPRQSLRARAALIFGGLALAFVLLAGGSAEVFFRRQLTRQLGPTFETLAVQIADKLDRGLDDRLRTLQLAARLSAVKDPAASVAVRRAALDALLAAAPDCVWIGFADREGRIVAAAPQLFEGSATATQAWFRGGGRGPFAGSPRGFPELARALGIVGDETPQFLDLAVPVVDDTGAPLGVLAAQLRWSWARDTQHSVVSDTARRDRLGVTIYAAGGEELLDTRASGWTHPPEAPAIGAKAGAHGYFVEDVPGDAEFFTGYARARGFRDFRGTNWLVAVRQPIADAFAPAQGLHRQIVWLGVALVSVIAVASWVIAGRFARRMSAVATAAGRIRGGDVLTLMPQPRDRGEVSSMCGALGELVDDFRQKQEALESENIRLRRDQAQRDR